jgi:hypothetical protein
MNSIAGVHRAGRLTEPAVDVVECRLDSEHGLLEQGRAERLGFDRSGSSTAKLLDRCACPPAGLLGIGPPLGGDALQRPPEVPWGVAQDRRAGSERSPLGGQEHGQRIVDDRSGRPDQLGKVGVDLRALLPVDFDADELSVGQRSHLGVLEKGVRRTALVRGQVPDRN